MNAARDDEVVLVDCREEARPGVPFSLRLTDRRVSYSQLVSFKRHRSETRNAVVTLCDRVELGRRSPWPLWIAGVILVGSAVVLAMRPSWSWWAPVLVLMFGVGCLASARRRFVLSWREGDRRHRVVQPMSLRHQTATAMTAAMREVARYLGDPAVLAAEVARRRALAVIEPLESGAALDADRRLCPDGSCVGLVGDDGRCKVCGA